MTIFSPSLLSFSAFAITTHFCKSSFEKPFKCIVKMMWGVHSPRARNRTQWSISSISISKTYNRELNIKIIIASTFYSRIFRSVLPSAYQHTTRTHTAGNGRLERFHAKLLANQHGLLLTGCWALVRFVLAWRSSELWIANGWCGALLLRQPNRPFFWPLKFFRNTKKWHTLTLGFTESYSWRGAKRYFSFCCAKHWWWWCRWFKAKFRASSRKQIRTRDSW